MQLNITEVKLYKRARIIRVISGGITAWVFDVRGNHDLLFANERALRFLKVLRKKK